MEQPPPPFSAASHPGLAHAVTAFAQDKNGHTWATLAAQLAYGWILLDGTGTSAPSGPYGTTFQKGDVLAIRTLKDPDGGDAIAVFTSQAEIWKTRAEEERATTVGLVQPADSLYGLLDAMDCVSIVIDPGSNGTVLSREHVGMSIGRYHDPGLRSVLELGGRATHDAVVEAFREKDGVLTLAAIPGTIGEDGSLDRVQLVHGPNDKKGKPLFPVYTSEVEVALHTQEATVFFQDYDGVLNVSLGAGFAGIVINPGSSAFTLERWEVDAAARGRKRIAAKTEKKAVKDAAKELKNL